MSDKHGLLDTIKHLAFEEEPTKAAPETTPAAAPAVAPAMTAITPPAGYPLPIDTGVASDNDEVYQRILSRTDFEGTDAAATIRKFLDPLKAISDTVMPPSVKFQTAVVQAKAQAGLTEDSILATFDTLKASLQQEEDAFNQKAQQFAAREVKGRQDRIGQITAQITQFQQELAQLSGELVEAQGKSTHAQSQFVAAVQRRRNEIEQQKAHYTALLKG
ncbi:MAG: hypothetical protein ABSF98_03340 [Bryobacteraceae bacterium]|jgi:hypothetical protein